MYCNFFSYKRFKSVWKNSNSHGSQPLFSKFLILLLCIEFVFGQIAALSVEVDSLEQTQQSLILEPDAEFINQVPGTTTILTTSSSSCHCGQELSQLQRELEEMRQNFQNYKDTQLEILYNTNERIQLIISSVQSGQIHIAKKHLNFLHDHILNENLLDKTTRQILRSFLLNTNSNFNSPINSTLQCLTNFQLLTPRSLQFPLYNFLFDELDSRKFLENYQVLKESVRLLSLLFFKQTSSNFTESANGNGNADESSLNSLNNSPEIRLWSKETEVKIVNRLVVNLLNGLVANDILWLDLGAWFNSEFFSTFLFLSEQECYEIVLDTIQTQYDDKLILTYGQLNYIKILYYFSFRPAPTSSSTTFNRISINLIQNANREQWRKRREVFSRPLIHNSIDGDILTRVIHEYSHNGTLDISQIGLKYLKKELFSDSLFYGGYDEEDFYFSHFADVCLHAVQNGVMTYEPKDADFWKLLRYFEKAKDVLPKYPFLIDDVKAVVFDLYNSNTNSNVKTNTNTLDKEENFHSALEFISVDLPYYFKLDGLKQLISLMRENGHLYRGNQVFILADLLLSLNLRNNSIWNELPEQTQLLADYSTDKGLLWQMRVTREFNTSGGSALSQETDDEMSLAGYELEKVVVSTQYEIFARDDYTIGFNAVSSWGTNVRNYTNDQRVWYFDTSYVPTLKLVRSQISLISTPPSHGGLVIGMDEDGERAIRHVKNNRDRSNGKFAVFWPTLSQDGTSFQLNFGKNEHMVLLLQDEDGDYSASKPLALVVKSKLEPPPSSVLIPEFIVRAEK